LIRIEALEDYLNRKRHCQGDGDGERDNDVLRRFDAEVADDDVTNDEEVPGERDEHGKTKTVESEIKRV
jgi:hypothetical protein